jgi:N-acetylmuramoyl-L-alanine amidase
LIKFLKFNFYIKDEDIIFHSDIAPNRKKDPGEKFIVKKLGIERFNFHQRKKFSINRLLKFYGFSQNYIKIHKADCIKAVKRSLNYKTIDSSVSKNFKNKFNNLLFK